MEKQLEDNLTSEQINKIDLLILNILKEGLLDQNIDFIDVMDYFNDQIIIDLNCSKETFKRRVMYNFGLGYLTLIEINNEMMIDENFINEIKRKCKKRGVDFTNIFGAGDNGKKFINLDYYKKVFSKKAYYSNFLEAKITAEGLKYIEELEKKLEESKGFGVIINKFKDFGEKFLKMKVAIGVGLTIICIGTIFIFDIKVSKIIAKIPLLSSIIDTNILETFENVNENDEFYQQLNVQIKNSPGMLKTLQDIKVKNISSNEKTFRINLENGQQQLINVVKDASGEFNFKAVQN